jgi:ribonucleoside-diphosphate reductase alpha chain
MTSPIALSDNAKLVLQHRYLAKDSEGKVIETPESLFERVATAVAEADTIFDPSADVQSTTRTFSELLTNLWFLPNSPTLMNAGRPLGQLAACFVLPVEDSLEGIFESLKQAAIIHKSGGGTGFSFSNIRPEKDLVKSTAGVSSGPLSFMSVFDSATETVKQGAARRGANMAVLRVDHPDIEQFISAKNNPNQLNNFNISVALTDDFMEALEQGNGYDLFNPRTGETITRMPAEKIFDLIVTSAWLTGEPGIIFIDRINGANPTPHLGLIEATNPCGEQPLLPYESCTLGSINLSNMVDNGKINDSRLKQVVHAAVHFLDNVIEMNQYPLPVIEKITKQTRKIGLGVMGFADLLIKLKIAYDSETAIECAEKIMHTIRYEAQQASSKLAKLRGNFPAYNGSVFDSPQTLYMRNATTTTIAPTGTISIIAGASSGIEPLFAVAHVRKILDGKSLNEINPLFVKTAKSEGIFSESLAAKIAKQGSLKSIEGIPEHIKRLFKTSHDLSPQWHIRIQAAFQKFTDNAVSKTINFSSEAAPDDVKDSFLMAYKNGCKGLTIYRHGSRKNQVLDLQVDEPQKQNIKPRPRPSKTFGFTQRIRTGCGNLYVTVNSDDTGICEVFGKMGKTGGCASSQIESVGRLISLSLRSGVSAEAVVKQLIGIRCPSPAWENGKMVLSCHDAIAQVLKQIACQNFVQYQPGMGVCPDCSDMLVHEEGCLVCHSCGYSKCS